MLVGHTKPTSDWCFGLLKQRYKKTFISSLDDIIAVVNGSVDGNTAPLFFFLRHTWHGNTEGVERLCTLNLSDSCRQVITCRHDQSYHLRSCLQVCRMNNSSTCSHTSTSFAEVVLRILCAPYFLPPYKSPPSLCQRYPPPCRQRMKMTQTVGPPVPKRLRRCGICSTP